MTRNEEQVRLLQEAGYDGFDLPLASKLNYPTKYGIQLTEGAKSALGNVIRAKGLSQVEQIEEFIRINGSITSLDATNALYIMALARRIKDMEEMGYKIEREWETSSTGARYRRYRIGGKSGTEESQEDNPTPEEGQ